MAESLDEIMSGRSEDAPAPETNEQPAIQQSEPQQPQGDEGEGDQPQQGMVPHAALHAEKQKVKRYTEQVASFEQRMADQDARWEQRFNQLFQSFQRPQQQPQQPAPRPDLYENPQGFVQSEVKELVDPRFQQFEQAMLHNSRLVANSIYGGAEKVNAAEQAFMTALQQGKVDPADYHRVVNSPNRYAEAVEWHKRQSVLSETGGDLTQYRQKLLDDPDFMAEVAKKLGVQNPAQPQPQAQPAVDPNQIPSSFNGRNAGPSNAPTWSGPRPLSELMPR